MIVLGINVVKPCEGVLVIRREPHLDRSKTLLTVSVHKTVDEAVIVFREAIMVVESLYEA